MSGITFSKPTNIFWPNSIGMMRRTAAIRLHVTTHVQKTLNGQSRHVSGKYKSIPTRRMQFIVFGNSRLCLEQYHVAIKDFFEHNQFHGDLVLIITGPMLKEQKFFYTNLLLSTPSLPTILRSSENGNMIASVVLRYVR
jgi:hypothetical protein